MKKQQSVSEFVISSIANADLRTKFESLPKAEDAQSEISIFSIANREISSLNCDEISAVAETIECGLNGQLTIQDAEILAAAS